MAGKLGSGCCYLTVSTEVSQYSNSWGGCVSRCQVCDSLASAKELTGQPGPWPSSIRSRQSFSVMDQIINILGLVSNTLSVPATHFCCYNMKAATDSSKQMIVTVFPTDFVYKNHRLDLAYGPWLADPCSNGWDRCTHSSFQHTNIYCISSTWQILHWTVVYCAKQGDNGPCSHNTYTLMGEAKSFFSIC